MPAIPIQTSLKTALGKLLRHVGKLTTANYFADIRLRAVNPPENLAFFTRLVLINRSLAACGLAKHSKEVKQLSHFGAIVDESHNTVCFITCDAVKISDGSDKSRDTTDDWRKVHAGRFLNVEGTSSWDDLRMFEKLCLVDLKIEAILSDCVISRYTTHMYHYLACETKHTRPVPRLVPTMGNRNNTPSGSSTCRHGTKKIRSCRKRSAHRARLPLELLSYFSYISSRNKHG